MSESEVRLALVRQWVRRAEVDLGLATLGMQDPEFYLQGIGFHCQQAAEKMLKAFLVQEDVVFPKTHNLMALIALCCDLDEAFAELAPACDRLNPLAVETRYGDLPPLSEPAEADEVLELAKHVYTWVGSRITT